eukprot:61737_1
MERNDHEWWKMIKTIQNPINSVRYNGKDHYDIPTKALVLYNELRRKYQYTILSDEELEHYKNATDKVIETKQDEFNASFEYSEVLRNVIDFKAKLKTSASCGLFYLNWAIVKHLNNQLITTISWNVMNARCIPSRTSISKLSMIPKKGKGKYRGIRSVGFLKSFIEYAIDRDAKSNSDIVPVQHGASGVAVQLIQFRLVIEISVLLRRPICVTVADLDSAFDRCHPVVNKHQYVHEQERVDKRLISVKDSLEQCNYLVPFVNGIATKVFPQKTRKSQGGRMSSNDYAVHTSQSIKDVDAHSDCRGVLIPLFNAHERANILYNVLHINDEIFMNILSLLYVDDIVNLSNSIIWIDASDSHQSHSNDSLLL